MLQEKISLDEANETGEKAGESSYLHRQYAIYAW